MNPESTDQSGLTELGKGATRPTRKLETFPNQHEERDYVVELQTDEFTCLCPATGQPDFAEILIRYVPDQKIVESKSLKLYLNVRTGDDGKLFGAVTNSQIADELKKQFVDFGLAIAGGGDR